MRQLHYLLAFSGGLDSTVLLSHFAQALKTTPEVSLSAIHVHHGLQAKADDWTLHCQKLCDHWHIPLTIVYVDANAAHGESPEAAARNARYQAFEQHITPHTILVTGHHQDDQAETLLLQLLRGAGAKGLSAMAEWKVLKQGWHYRPLLNTTRAQLQQIARDAKLCWIEDPSNDNHQYARNALRHTVLPILAQYWPSYSKTLSRSAQCLAESHSLLTQFAHEQLKQLGATRDYLPLNEFLHFSLAHQALLLRAWLETFECPLPSRAKLHQFLQNLISAKQDRHPCLPWAGGKLYRYKQRLYWACNATPDTVVAWSHFPAAIKLNLHATLTASAQGDLRCLSDDEIARLTIRYWSRGGRFHPSDRVHSQSIKKLMQAWCIPMELRHTVPLLYCGDELIAIVGYAIAKQWHGSDWEIKLEINSTLERIKSR